MKNAEQMLQKIREKQAERAAIRASLPVPESKFYERKISVVTGDQRIVFSVPSMSVEQISIKTTCKAELLQLLHGDRDFLLEGVAPIDLTQLPDGWSLLSEPGETFIDGLLTTFVIHTEEPGELTVLFREKALS